MDTRHAAALLLTVALAGCLGAAPAPGPTGGAPPAPGPATSILLGSVEPSTLEAPVFQLLGAVARAGPQGGAGEPSLRTHTDGTAYLAFPGCERDRLQPMAAPACANGPVYRSDDAGATWTRLNREGDGALTDGSEHNANGDNEVTVDAAGNVYASDLGSGIQVFRSADRGGSWSWIGNVTPPQAWADRQWMAAAHPGHLILAWMGGKDDAQRAVAVNTTFDGGATWTGTTYLGEDIGWLGPVVFDPKGKQAFVPFTQGLPSAGPVPFIGPFVGAADYSLMLGRTLDGGRTWEAVDTGAKVTRSGTGGHWSGVLMAPAMDVTGDGTLVYAWSEEANDPTGTTSTGAMLKLMASRDGGTTWTEPAVVSERAQAIMPWVTGGAGDRAAITYFASDVPADTDVVGVWDAMAMVVDDLASGQPKVVHSLIEAGVHQGGLCSKGSGCFFGLPSDRALLDFFMSDLLPDGRLMVAYPADPLAGAKYVEIRVAVQDGGTLLMEPPGGRST